MKKIYYLFILLIFLFALVIGQGNLQKVSANFCDFGCGDCSCDFGCHSCKPTPTPTTEEPEPTPTPTEVPEEPIPTTSAPASQGDGGVGGSASDPGCGASKPNSPYLIRAIALGGNKVKIEWNKVDNATHYTISYGPSSANYLYGVSNAGDTDNFTIDGIGGGCFIVYAVNDCAPSNPSNEACTGQVLGTRTKVLGATSGVEKQGAILQLLGLLMLITGVKGYSLVHEKKG